MAPSSFRFVEDASPIRLVLGQPGSGKTTVIWKAIEARSGDRVFYPTWSRELTEQRRRASPCFAPKDMVVDTRDFVTFLGEILGAGVERRSITDSRAAFNAAVAGVRLARNQWGPLLDVLASEAKPPCRRAPYEWKFRSVETCEAGSDVSICHRTVRGQPLKM